MEDKTKKEEDKSTVSAPLEDKKEEVKKTLDLKPEDENKVEKSGVVEVDKGVLESMMREIEMLKEVADKGRLAQFYSRNKKDLPKIVKVRMLDGKLVVGWKMIIDEVFEDSVTHGWKEKQIVKLVFLDGETQEISLRDFVRKYTHVFADVLSTTVNNDGDEALKVQRKDNEEIFEIGVKYIN